MSRVRAGLVAVSSNTFRFRHQKIKYKIEITNQFSILYNIYVSRSVNTVILSGQIVTCTNGIDNTSMSVSYNLVQHLREQYDLKSEDEKTLTRSLRQGVLLQRAGQNRQYPHYMFPGQMFLEYQPWMFKLQKVPFSNFWCGLLLLWSDRFCLY